MNLSPSSHPFNRRVSVIIPCCNSGEFLSAAIDSVLQQTHPAFEVLVVDDGSNARTALIAKRYAQVRYLQAPQGGLAAARNYGIQHSQGDYVVFLDANDRLSPQALEVGINCLETIPTCSYAVGLGKLLGDRGLPWQAARELREQALGISLYHSLLQGNPLRPSARLIFRRGVFDRLGGFDPALAPAEDYDLCLRAAERFLGCRHNQIVVEYRENSRQLRCPSRHLQVCLKALDRQRLQVQKSQDNEASWQQGKQHWCHLYGPSLSYEATAHFRKGNVTSLLQVLYLLLRYYPQGLTVLLDRVIAKLRQLTARLRQGEISGRRLALGIRRVGVRLGLRQARRRWRLSFGRE